MWGCMNIWGAYEHHLSLIGTSYLKLTIPLHVLPSYFKNRTVPCCDRLEYSLFTAASTLVVRVRSVCMQLVGVEETEKHIKRGKNRPIS